MTIRTSDSENTDTRSCQL